MNRGMLWAFVACGVLLAGVVLWNWVRPTKQIGVHQERPAASVTRIASGGFSGAIRRTIPGARPRLRATVVSAPRTTTAPQAAPAVPRSDITTAWEDREHQWEQESDDPDWTQTVVNYLSTMMSPGDGGSGIDLIQSVECRQTLCRLVVEPRQLPFLARVAKTAGRDGYSFTSKFHLAPPGGAVVLLSRDATEAASPE